MSAFLPQDDNEKATPVAGEEHDVESYERAQARTAEQFAGSNSAPAAIGRPARVAQAAGSASPLGAAAEAKADPSSSQQQASAKLTPSQLHEEKLNPIDAHIRRRHQASQQSTAAEDEAPDPSMDDGITKPILSTEEQEDREWRAQQHRSAKEHEKTRLQEQRDATRPATSQSQQAAAQPDHSQQQQQQLQQQQQQQQSHQPSHAAAATSPTPPVRNNSNHQSASPSPFSSHGPLSHSVAVQQASPGQPSPIMEKIATAYAQYRTGKKETTPGMTLDQLNAKYECKSSDYPDLAACLQNSSLPPAAKNALKSITDPQVINKPITVITMTFDTVEEFNNFIANLRVENPELKILHPTVNSAPGSAPVRAAASPHSSEPALGGGAASEHSSASPADGVDSVHGVKAATVQPHHSPTSLLGAPPVTSRTESPSFGLSPDPRGANRSPSRAGAAHSIEELELDTSNPPAKPLGYIQQKRRS